MIDQLPAVDVIREKQLRINISGVAEWEGEPLYVVILKNAATLGIASGTVQRALFGFAANGNPTRTTNPMVIVIVDREPKIEQLIVALRPMLIAGSMMSVSDVAVVAYKDPSIAKQHETDAEAPRS